MKRTMRIFSIVLIVYFLWTEVWIGLFMGRIYTIRQWGYNNAIYKIFLYSYSIDTYIRIILEIRRQRTAKQAVHKSLHLKRHLRRMK